MAVKPKPGPQPLRRGPEPMPAAKKPKAPQPVARPTVDPNKIPLDPAIQTAINARKPQPETPDYGGGSDDGGDGGRDESVIDYSNWADLLGQFGFDAEIQDAVNKMFSQGYTIGQIIAWIRGTNWYKITYPGISEGIAKGILRDERDYRSYVNEVNQLYRRYYDRLLTSEETRAYLTEGVTPGIVKGRLEGQAYIKANRGEIQYYAGAFGEGRYGENELRQYGEQKAGLGSQVGARLETALELATQRFRRVFEGVNAVAGFGVSGSSLSAPSLRPERAARPDVAA